MNLIEEDKVKLHDSLIEMKVMSIQDNYVHCKWINRLGAEMIGSFPISVLTKVN
ncbi:hypothetical protein [uncultured Aquimarina sp.]|uniref:hypothetical protein n=1 Tax=uncultured Aquimarina sp. TaxID=575652 RepID=UPI002607DB0E|nr:hypothetical protein [uncultured Aquimarina sp.]